MAARAVATGRENYLQLSGAIVAPFLLPSSSSLAIFFNVIALSAVFVQIEPHKTTFPPHPEANRKSIPLENFLPLNLRDLHTPNSSNNFSTRTLQESLASHSTPFGEPLEDQTSKAPRCSFPEALAKPICSRIRRKIAR